MRTLIKNVTIFNSKDPVSVEEGMDVLISDDLIEEVGKGLGSEADFVIDGKERILMPGLVCAHHHYYSAFSRGMSLPNTGPQRDFVETLQNWWWKLDRALDEESIYYSSLVASMEAIKAGTTSVVDHHASPSFIKNSLMAIASGMEKVGIRGITCYEITDRNEGEKEVLSGLDENISFASYVDARKKEDPKYPIEAMIGAHAPFTVPDYALRLIKEGVEEVHRGLHIHVAEDKFDVSHSHAVYRENIIERLLRHGLIDNKTLLVHGVHLYPDEIGLINERDAFLAHNARSNMNNQVGYCHNIKNVKNLVLGTDGCGGNMFEEIKIAFFKNRDASLGFWPSDFLSALTRGNDLVEREFSGKIRLGRIEKGYKADLVLLSYKSPTAFADSNAAGHLVWGMGSSDVESVMVNGTLIYDQKHFLLLDEEEIYEKARKAAGKVWLKADSLE